METKSVPASWIRHGNVILESEDHPAIVTRVTRLGSRHSRIWCRYTWQRRYEPDWPLGDFGPEDLVEVVK
jgi:hypothetical protein